MQLQDFYPIVVTEHLAGCRDFYGRWFGLDVVFQASWFVLMGARTSPFRCEMSRSVSDDSVCSIRPASGSMWSSRSSRHRAGGTDT